jgi:diguanylate cyclase (GGDEF)-like protein
VPNPFADLDAEIGEETSRASTAVRVFKGAKEHAALTVLTGLSAGRVHVILGDSLLIGRNSSCGLRLNDPGISREHCRITCSKSGQYAIEDLKSTNGTFLDGKEFQHASLWPGQRIQVGPDVVLRFAFALQDEEALARRLYESSTRDGLTSAFTRRYFDERFEAELAYARRHKTTLSVLMVDIDHFKKVNDTHGHPAGDAVLRAVAANLHALIRTEDLLARYGGEEFVILTRGLTPQNAARFAERVRTAIAKLPIVHENTTMKVTVSVGVATERIDSRSTKNSLFAAADKKLYTAKNSGRNRVVC